MKIETPTALVNALQRRRELLAAVAEIDAFVEQYRRFAAGEPARPRRTRLPGVRPRDVADAAVEVIRKSDRPLTRAEIAEVLVGDGIALAARSPAGYVGTQLWRFARDRVRAVDGNGFVAIDAALPPPPQSR